jgi:hypothetical protein
LLLKRVIPRAGLAVVPNSGHVLNLEEPELFNDLIRTLVGAAEAGTRSAVAVGVDGHRRRRDGSVTRTHQATH